MSRCVAMSVGLMALVATTSEAAAQDLAERVAAVGTGSATFAYPMREDAEICEQGVSIGGRRTIWRARVRDGRDRSNIGTRCTTGVASVELRVQAGVVRDVGLLEPDDMIASGSVNLGEASAREAADYFLALARTADPDDVAEDAVFAAVLAGVDEVWRDFLEIARDPSIQRDVRGASLFWLGQEAGDAVTTGIATIAADEREEQDIREAAIFALSQRPGDVGVVPLMELARTAREAETRRTAMFWLAQSEDPRVLAFFEEILLGR